MTQQQLREAENQLECQIEAVLRRCIIPALTGNGGWCGTIENLFVEFKEVQDKPYFRAEIEYNLPFFNGADADNYQEKTAFFSAASVEAVALRGHNFSTDKILSIF